MISLFVLVVVFAAGVGVGAVYSAKVLAEVKVLQADIAAIKAAVAAKV